MKLGRKIFALGALAFGAVAGLLLAPKKGSQTRKELLNEWDKGGSGVKTLKETGKKVGEDISQVAQEVKESKVLKKGQKKVEGFVTETVSTVKEEGKKFLLRAKKKFKELTSREEKSDQ
jgi:gas vesicle protein